MRILVFICLVAISGTAALLANPFDQGWSADKKAKFLWDNITASQGSGTWMILWPFKVMQFIFQDMSLTFTQTDFMRPLWSTLFLFPRPKVLHAEGAIQQIRWEVVPNEEGYTGLFKSGSEYGLVRYSVAGPYEHTKVNGDLGMIPGVAIKLFRDGQHSGNFHAMSSLKGTKTHNFFESNLRTHLMEPAEYDLFVLAGMAKLAEGSSYCFTLGTRDFSEYDAAGNPEYRPKFPFRLTLVPQVSLPEKYATASQRMYFNDAIAESLKRSEQLLFKVYAFAEPADTHTASHNPKLIANIWSKSGAVKSLFADEEVMFTHNKFERDVALKPDWANHVPTCSTDLLSPEMALGRAKEESFSFPTVASANPRSKCPFGF